MDDNTKKDLLKKLEDTLDADRARRGDRDDRDNAADALLLLGTAPTRQGVRRTASRLPRRVGWIESEPAIGPASPDWFLQLAAPDPSTKEWEEPPPQPMQSRRLVMGCVGWLPESQKTTTSRDTGFVSMSPSQSQSQPLGSYDSDGSYPPDEQDTPLTIHSGRGGTVGPQYRAPAAAPPAAAAPQKLPALADEMPPAAAAPKRAALADETAPPEKKRRGAAEMKIDDDRHPRDAGIADE